MAFSSLEQVKGKKKRFDLIFLSVVDSMYILESVTYITRLNVVCVSVSVYKSDRVTDTLSDFELANL